jgi:MFS family permease
MRATLDLLRHERRSRLFFVALAQSALGTGAGYVALLLIAKGRFESPWAISLVLIADLVPAMLLGPFFGALADRWSRKRCMVAADVLRAGAFLGIALVDSYVATLAFALVAGIGTGLFTPAALAALPSVVDDERHVPATTSLYGVVADLGFTVGPAIAGGIVALGGADSVMLVNAATFALSAALLTSLRFGHAPAIADGPRPSLARDVREGLQALVAFKGVRILLLGSAAGLFCAGLFNVAEIFFAEDEIGLSSGAFETGFALLVACFGVGFIGGSLVGASGGAPSLLKRRYLIGLLALGVSLLGTGLTETYAVAVVTFAFAGFGNGLLLVYERLLIQATVEDRLVGRIFGAKDALTAWAFGIAFLAGGALVTAIGAREVLLAAGGLALLVFAATAIALRGEWTSGEPAWDGSAAALDGRADLARGDGAVLGEQGADVVGRGGG